MVDDDSRLDALFQRYRVAYPDVDPQRELHTENVDED